MTKRLHHYFFFCSQRIRQITKSSTNYGHSSIVLVPVWKVYGFTQADGSAGKNGDLVSNVKTEKLSVKTNHMPFKWPITVEVKEQEQTEWQNQLLHRSRSTST